MFIYMSNISIFTLCTKNYEEAANLVLPTWSRLASINNIFVYTDFNYIPPVPKITVLQTIEPCDNWLKIVGLKVKALQHLLETAACTDICYLDIDCYVLADFSEIFDIPFDIAATRMCTHKDANSGVWCCRANEAINKFANEWEQLQDTYIQKGIGLVEHRSPYEQKSFSSILHRELQTPTYLKVHPLDAAIYNSEHDNIIKWKRNVKATHPKILHFKKHTWKDKDLVKDLITCA